jgi:nicotinamidase/pyrazinamidase
MPVSIDPDRDALVIVDVLNRYAERFAARGAPVFASRDWHPAETTHFAAYGGVWPPHCVQDTAGADFHPDLALPAGTAIVSKGMDPRADAYSCFQAETPDGLPFAAMLGDHGVSRLFVGGLATDYCVRATVVDGIRAGFEVILLEDAVAAVDLTPGDGAKALDEMRAAGARLIRLVDLA